MRRKKLLTRYFFPKEFIIINFEIFLDSWGCLLYHETYLVNNHNLVPSLEPWSHAIAIFVWFGLVVVFLAFMTSVMKKMAPHEFLLPINLKKSKKLWKFGFSNLWPLFGLQKNFQPFFQFSWPSDVLNIQNHSNLNYLEYSRHLKARKVEKRPKIFLEAKQRPEVEKPKFS